LIGSYTKTFGKVKSFRSMVIPVTLADLGIEEVLECHFGSGE